MGKVTTWHKLSKEEKLEKSYEFIWKFLSKNGLDNVADLELREYKRNFKRELVDVWVCDDSRYKNMATKFIKGKYSDGDIKTLGCEKNLELAEQLVEIIKRNNGIDS